MRVLIVGCGYVGVPLGAELVRSGHDVFGMRRTDSGRAELEQAGVKLLQCDVTRLDDLRKLSGSYDWVVNTVASSHGGPDSYRKVYLNGTRNLIEWLKDTPPRKYVYTSSTGVYHQTDGSTVDESSPTNPAAETGQILVQTEQALLEAVREQRFPAVILRVAGIYGPGRGYFFRQYLKNEARITGQGERIINMIHRDDVAGAILAALNQGCPGEIYNAVDDEPVTQMDFFRWLSKKLNRPMPPLVPETENHNRKRALTHKKISNRKLKTDLGYSFKHPTFREGCEAELACVIVGGQPLK